MQPHGLSNEAEDWFSLAIPLIKELDDPQRMATKTPTQVIANAARLRGLTPRAIGKQILAAKFLRETYPGLLGSGPMRGGYSQVEYLAKIHQFDPALADRLVGLILSAEISMAQMRVAYDEVVAHTGGPTSNAAKTKQRGLAFEAACELAIRAQGEFFQLTDRATLVQNYRLVDAALDFAVLRNGRVISAIEVRIGGLVAARRDASTLTARLALFATRVEHVYLLVPEESEELADAMTISLRDWGVDRVHVARVTEQPPHRIVCTTEEAPEGS